MNRLALAAIAVSSFVVTARAQSLYAVSSNGTLWTVDATTGAAAQLANQVSNVAAADGLAYDPASDTVFMATLLDSLFTIDLVNGTSTFVGSFSPSIVLIHDIVWDSSTGTLYGASLHNNGLYKIDTTTAAVTQVGTSGLLGNTNLGYDSINDVMFATNSTTDSLYVVDRVTGGATLVSPLSGSINPRSLAFDNDTDTMYLLDSSTVGLYSLDTNTGTATLIGSTLPFNSGSPGGLVYLPTALGSFQRITHGCGPTTIATNGAPVPGGTITTTLAATIGTPVIGLGLNLFPTPVCTCTIGHEWNTAFFSVTSVITVPTNPVLVGVDFAIQGADFQGAGGCPIPMITLTDTIIVTIG